LDIYLYLSSFLDHLASLPASQQTSDLSIINAWALFTHIFLFKVFQFFPVRQERYKATAGHSFDIDKYVAGLYPAAYIKHV